MNDVPADPARCMIDQPYLIALNVGLRRHQGGYWADASWAKDIDKHRAYLPRLTMFCPVEDVAPDTSWRRIDGDGLRVVPLPMTRSWLMVPIHLPIIFPRLLREVREAAVVHSGVAGWPIPLGWMAAPLARAFGKPLVLIVESSFWRVPSGGKAGMLARGNAWVGEAMARWCMRMADYAAYTQPDYARTLPAPRARAGGLVQASWIDAADCLDDAVAEQAWKTRCARTPAFLYASRLVPEKGAEVVAGALAILAERGAEIMLDVIGEGPSRDRIARAAETEWGRAHVRLLAPRPYDRRFLSFVGEYHALVVPGLSDEQPRIVYDGCSQAVPTIGSDLAGMRACVVDGVTGLLVASGDAAALAGAIMAAAADPGTLRGWGMTALARARTLTHDGLHADRCLALKAMLAERGLN